MSRQRVQGIDLSGEAFSGAQLGAHEARETFDGITPMPLWRPRLWSPYARMCSMRRAMSMKVIHPRRPAVEERQASGAFMLEQAVPAEHAQGL